MRVMLFIFSLFFGSMMLFAHDDGYEISVYESPSCGCCKLWSNYMSKNGFEVKEIKTGDLMSIKSKYGIKDEYMSCHTAIVDGYVVEGHVPYQEVLRLLSEKPDGVIGISTPGMPLGSPGMEQGNVNEVYDVLLLRKDGSTEVYATYKGKEKTSK